MKSIIEANITNNWAFIEANKSKFFGRWGFDFVSYFFIIWIIERKYRNRQKEITQNIELVLLWSLKSEDI